MAGLPTYSALAVNAPLFVSVTAVTAFVKFAPLFENSVFLAFCYAFTKRTGRQPPETASVRDLARLLPVVIWFIRHICIRFGSFASLIL